jgi:putative aldouronate transport system substrate-binding protein
MVGGAAAAAPLLAACGGDDAADTGAESTTAGGATQGGGSTQGAGGGTPSAAGSGTNAGSGGSGAAGAGGLPTRVEFIVAPPDLPALDNGTPAGYSAYPASPKQVYSEVPAKGGTISFLKNGDVPLPLPKSKNQWWQELDKRVGASMEITQVASDYAAKLSTTIAGGDLPDYVQMVQSYPHLPDVMKAKFQDLSPWLAGDAIKQFKSLASIPTYGWRAANFNGGIWGIPWAFGSLVGSENRARQDILDDVGFDGNLSNGDDFLALCKEVTDVKHSRWALGDLQTSTATMALEMAGAPNAWKVENGKFTRSFETDEYKRGLSLANQIWKAGYVYPDVSGDLVKGQTYLMAGKAVLLRQAYTNWPSLAIRGADDPKFRQGGIILPKWDGGGQAGHFLSSGVYTFTALKKASDDRIKELLTVLDWFATPFGSEEYLFTRYGIPDRDYKLKGSDPVETDTGVNECKNMIASYYATNPAPLYIAGLADQTKAQYEEISKLMKVTVPLPTVGLFSDTQLSTGATIDKNMANLQLDIISGRKPVSAWDGGVKSWRSAGGDKIRSEYEQAYAANHS